MIALALRVLALLFACAFAVARPAAQQPPNVLLLFADDLRSDAVGAFADPAGRAGVHTPTLDGLAARGVRFDRVYCMGSRHGAVCQPSRAMLMSGLPLAAVRDDLQGATTLPERLRERGYRTFMTGKWHNGDAALRRAFPEARSVFRGGMCSHFAVPLCDLRDGAIADERTGDRHSSELFADAAIEFLREHGSNDGDRKQPWFAYVAFTAPHDPRDPPPQWRKKLDDELPAPTLPTNFRGQHGLNLGPATMTVRDENLLGWPRDPDLLREQLRDYRALVGHLDAQIDRILAALDATGQRDNTLVVFAADHGLALGSHGLLGKQSLYEHSMRAPVILAGPGLPAGSVRHGLAYLLDLHETILAATAPPLSPGEEALAPAEFARDLLPVARGEATGREEVYLAYADGQRALVTAKDKLIRLPQIDRSLWFDLHGDPHELTPTAIAAERRAALTERLQAWERTRGTNLPWTADKLLPAELDLTGKRWPPDRWQPQWIVDKFFPAGGQTPRK